MIYTTFISFFVFILIDMPYLLLFANPLFQKTLGHIAKNPPNLIAAGVFYLIYVIGINYFVISKAQSWQQCLINGFLLGFFAYATYDLTNLATIDKWPIKLVFIDMIWGGILTASVCSLTLIISKYFKLI